MDNMQLKEYLAKKNKKYLIFDFDETIAKMEIDWSGWHTGIGEVYRQYNPQARSYAADEHSRYNGYVDKFGQELVKKTQQFNAQYETEMTTGFIPYPELIKFIKKDNQYQKFVYSSNSSQVVIKGLKELGIVDKFKKIVSRDDVTYIKPHPEGFSLLCDREIPHSEYLFIGNSHADKKAARAAGIDFFLVEYFRPIF